MGEGMTNVPLSPAAQDAFAMVPGRWLLRLPITGTADGNGQWCQK
jgi:hypothetical protein